MATKTTTVPEITLADELRDAVSKIDGVALIASPKGDYYTVKVGKTTLGYVNGKRKLRVDFPVRAGKREQLVVDKSAAIAKAVAKLVTFVPVVDAPKVDEKPKATPRKRNAAKPKASS